MKIDIPVVIKSFDEHNAVKDTVLRLLDDQKSSEACGGNEHITKTDWFVDVHQPRDYWDFLAGYLWPRVLEVCINSFHYPFNSSDNKVTNFWFQQYSKGDFHGWHRHGFSSVSAVYFLELPDNKGTEFKLPQSSEIYQPEVKEGDILIFPAFLVHRSPVNDTEKRKTIVAFNVG